MITDADIQKLKGIFVTKQELKEAITTSTDTIVKEFRIVLEMIGDLSIKVDQTNNNLEQTNKRLEDAITEIRTHRLAFGDYEKRMEKVEARLFREV